MAMDSLKDENDLRNQRNSRFGSDLEDTDGCAEDPETEDSSGSVKSLGASYVARTEETSGEIGEINKSPLTIETVAKEIAIYMPKQIGMIHAEDFILATAKLLLPCEPSTWKRLASDKDEDKNDDCKGKSRDEVSIASSSTKKIRGGATMLMLGKNLNELIQEKIDKGALSKADKIPIDRFRSGIGPIAKYFKLQPTETRNKGAAVAKAKHFAVIWAGFIAKLYLSKVGYQTLFPQMKADLGDYMAARALDACESFDIYQYKLVLPSTLCSQYTLVDGIADTDSISKQQQLHIIVETTGTAMMSNFLLHSFAPEPESIPKPIEVDLTGDNSENEAIIPRAVTASKHLFRNDPDCLDYEEKISTIEAEIQKAKSDIKAAEQVLKKKTDKIAQLVEEIRRLKIHQEQIYNDKSLTQNLREVIKNDEDTFKSITELVVEVAPLMQKILPKVKIDALKDAIMGTIFKLDLDATVGASCRPSVEQVKGNHVSTLKRIDMPDLFQNDAGSKILLPDVESCLTKPSEVEDRKVVDPDFESQGLRITGVEGNYKGPSLKHTDLTVESVVQDPTQGETSGKAFIIPEQGFQSEKLQSEPDVPAKTAKRVVSKVSKEEKNKPDVEEPPAKRTRNHTINFGSQEEIQGKLNKLLKLKK